MRMAELERPCGDDRPARDIDAADVVVDLVPGELPVACRDGEGLRTVDTAQRA
jgi:hypothetical protein